MDQMNWPLLGRSLCQRRPGHFVFVHVVLQRSYTANSCAAVTPVPHEKQYGTVRPEEAGRLGLDRVLARAENSGRLYGGSEAAVW
jgi:hypothetical protein